MDFTNLLATGLGALVGFTVAANPIGILAGALAGNYLEKDRMMKTRVFVSFDFDNDRVLQIPEKLTKYYELE